MPHSSNSSIQISNSQPVLHQQGREIQPFGALRNMPIALASIARSEGCEQLNQILADSIILYSLSQYRTKSCKYRQEGVL